MRTTKNYAIETPAQRRRLPADGKDRWRSLRPGLSVGWHRKGAGAGVWRARLALPGGKYPYTTIGPADDLPGVDGLDWKGAVEAAGVWARRCLSDPGVSAKGTVTGALVEYARLKPKRAYAVDLFQRKYLFDLGPVRLDRLTVARLQSWRRQLEGLKLGHSNYDVQIGIMSAALRKTEQVSFDLIRRGLAAEEPRRRVPTRFIELSEAQVIQFIKGCSAEDPDLGLLAELFAVTGCRPGQLSACLRKDLNVDEGLLLVGASDKGPPNKKKVDATVVVPAGLARRLLAAVPGPDGRLLGRWERKQTYDPVQRLLVWPSTGRRLAWKSAVWGQMVKRAVTRTGLDPRMTLYDLRRNYMIVARLNPVVSVLTLAKALDTSPRLIDSTYAAYLNWHPESIEQLRKVRVISTD